MEHHHGLKFSRADERSVGDSGSKTSGRHKLGEEGGKGRERADLWFYEGI